MNVERRERVGGTAGRTDVARPDSPERVLKHVRNLAAHTPSDLGAFARKLGKLEQRIQLLGHQGHPLLAEASMLIYTLRDRMQSMQLEASHAKAQAEWLARPVKTSPESIHPLADTDTAFGFSLLGRLAEEPGGNIFMSPYGIASTLRMALNGARGDTLDALGKHLGLPKMPLSELNEGSLELMRTVLEGDPEVAVKIANSVWLREQMKVGANFSDIVRRTFDGEIESLTPASVERINRWVAEKTKGEITRIIETLDPVTACILINAVYFYGRWTQLFKEHETRMQGFHRADGTTVSVPMMHMFNGSFRYIENGGFQMIRLPYGGERYSMTIMLPQGAAQTFAQFRQNVLRPQDSWLGYVH